MVDFYKYQVEQRGGNIQKDDAINDPFDIIARWYSKEDVSFKNWLCLTGSCGNGKTTMLRAMFEIAKCLHTVKGGKFARYAPFSCKYMTATELADIFVNDKSYFDTVKNYQLLFIDDVGTEPVTVLNYGNTLYPFKELVNHRYSNLYGMIFTTNLSAAELTQRYGERFGDRMRECCLKVPFLGESHRKQQPTAMSPTVAPF